MALTAVLQPDEKRTPLALDGGGSRGLVIEEQEVDRFVLTDDAAWITSVLPAG